MEKEKCGHLIDIEYPMEEGIDVHEERQAQKIPISMKNLDFMIFWLVSCLEENVKFDNLLIRYISNVFTFKLCFRNKISIYKVFNMLLTNIWYSLSSNFMNCHFLENNIKQYHFFTKYL